MIVRPARAAEIGPLAKLWYEGWQDAHATIVPPDLVRIRTLERFRERMSAGLGEVRAVGPRGAPTGFWMRRGDEVYQFYVAAAARGTGVAAILIADAEVQLAAAGVATAWLICAIGNERAARFYEKCGWHHGATIIDHLDTPEGRFPLEVWRYEKALR